MGFGVVFMGFQNVYWGLKTVYNMFFFFLID